MFHWFGRIFRLSFSIFILKCLYVNRINTGVYNGSLITSIIVIVVLVRLSKKSHWFLLSLIYFLLILILLTFANLT